MLFSYFTALPEPKLTVSRSEITETDSVTLKCEAPSSVPMSQCSFYSSTGATVKELPCLTTLTATELLKMANLKSPATVKLNCFYTTQPGAPNSPYSNFSSIIIQTPLPPKLIVNPLVITETDSVTLNCETPPSVSVPECDFYTLSGGIVNRFSCLTTLTATKLLELAHLRSPAEIKLKCSYTARSGELTSPYSNMSTIKVQRTTSKDGRTTDLTTVRPGNKTSGHKVHTGANLKDKRTTDFTTFNPGTLSSGETVDKDLLIWKLVVSTGCGVAVGVVLLGCVLVRNLKRTVPVNSVTSSSQAHCTDGLMNTTHLGEVSPPGNEQSYSIFTSVPAADPDSTQEDGQQLQKNESDIYHLYSTIPKEPATSALKSMVYSTVNPMYTSVNYV
ncbi:uncharacterized protein LOC113022433 isoform X2 [Astatotilapia calliptera]|uniref:uncharacterized protein LOC113022433 isoform X2 n=1 Tax=Astatotilapia calliptera TaxID=8154 RepID=UPI000E42C640|nr:uncharacterized protein LOC113022433 isoform X2 [Astatotilapia calliptera]